MSEIIKNILKKYESETPAVKGKLFQILNTGLLAGTGKMMILPVDQGFEHGPDRSFLKNPEGYDPHYLYKLAIEGGFNAYAAPKGLLEQGADTFAGQIPLILKMNSSNSLLPKDYKNDQAITATIADAIRLGCAAIGFTIYPGSEDSIEMFEEIAELSNEAKSYGIATVIWSYARGPELNKNTETALDVISYAAHMAALLGANIIKVKPPFNSNSEGFAFIHDEKNNLNNDFVCNKTGTCINKAALSERVKIVKKACMNRLVVFSGGDAKSEESILAEISAIAQGGGDGSIVGRNMFQRPFEEAKLLSQKIAKIYKDAR
jgi:class I fructose-bisphosphate aldolase